MMMSYLYVQGWRLADECQSEWRHRGPGAPRSETSHRSLQPRPLAWSPELGLCPPLIGHTGLALASDWLVVTQPPALESPPRPGLGTLAANAPWSEIREMVCVKSSAQGWVRVWVLLKHLYQGDGSCLRSA